MRIRMMRIRMMLALVMMALVAGIATMATPATAEVPNVGVVDMLRVSDSYARYAQSRQQLELRKLDLQTVVDEEEKSVMGLLEELEAVRATASQEDIARRRREIEARDRELRQFVQQTNMQFRDDLDTLQLRTKDEIETVVTMVARQKGLTVILERNMTLFAAESLDVTELVIAELNARFRPLPQSPVAGSARPAHPVAASETTSPTSAPTTSVPTSSASGDTSAARRPWPFRQNP